MTLPRAHGASEFPLGCQVTTYSLPQQVFYISLSNLCMCACKYGVGTYGVCVHVCVGDSEEPFFSPPL